MYKFILCTYFARNHVCVNYTFSSFTLNMLLFQFFQCHFPLFTEMINNWFSEMRTEDLEAFIRVMRIYCHYRAKVHQFNEQIESHFSALRDKTRRKNSLCFTSWACAPFYLCSFWTIFSVFYPQQLRVKALQTVQLIATTVSQKGLWFYAGEQPGTASLAFISKGQHSCCNVEAQLNHKHH